MPGREKFALPTDEQREYIARNPLMLKTGGVLGLQSGFINVALCMQHSLEKRKVQSIAAERLIREICTEESVAAFESAFQEYELNPETQEMEQVLNYKAFNLLRAPILVAQGTAAPGGKSGPADFAAYITMQLAMNAISERDGIASRYFGSVLCVHDGCAAALPHINTIIPWADAIRLTFHDLWRSDIGDRVDIYLADINTKDSTIKRFERIDTFNRSAYIHAMKTQEQIQTWIPEDGSNILRPGRFTPLREDRWTGDLYQKIAAHAL